MYSETKESLVQSLQNLLVQPDLLQVSRRRVLNYLCDLFRIHEYLAMSYEELIMRVHIDDRRGDSYFMTTEFFKIENLFNQLGIRTEQAEKVVQRLVRLGYLIETTVGDSQATFKATRWADIYTEKGVDETLGDLRRLAE